jgi:cytochrome c
MKKKIIEMFVVIFSFAFIISMSQSYSSVRFGRINKQGVQTPEGDKGIGPFKDVKVGPIDQAKVRKGLSIFMQKCFLCHDLDNKKLGPPLRNITKEDTPEFILNMIVNPTEMQKQNEKIKEQMKKYNNLPMLDQQISQPDALNILDYLRSVAK